MASLEGAFGAGRKLGANLPRSLWLKTRQLQLQQHGRNMKTYFRHLTIALALPALLTLVLQPSTLLATPVVTQIATGQDHSLFVMSDGSLWGMGDNSYGEIGLGTTITGANAPTEIVTSGVTTVAANYFTTLFRESDGSLWGTGYNNDGELGDGTYTTQFSPEKVASSGVTVIAE